MTMKSPLTKDITANGQSIVFDVRRYNTIKFMPKGTFSGVNVVFEASLDYGLTWVGVQAIRSNATTVETTSGALSATPAYNYRADVSGFTDFRIRSTAWTSGTQSWVVTGSTDQTDPIQPTASTSVTITEGTKLSGSAISVTTAASTNASSQKATAGNLFELTLSNPTATATYVKLYNKATAPTVGTDTPVLTIPVAAGALVTLQFGPQGKRFTTGIAMAVTAAAAATDTAVAVAGVQIHGTYI